MINFLTGLVDLVFRILTVVVVIDVIVSYFLSPYNNIRIFLDRIITPLLNPIRRIVPPVQMIDFSPIILLILLQVFEFIIVRLLTMVG